MKNNDFDCFKGQELLHTPEGVRDIYNSECQKKLILQNNMHKVLKLYGFQDIQTPTFEFFDIFNKERGTIASRDMYKFFDREGNTLVLRPDFTPSIARCTAKYYKEEELPIRLCYIGNTFINNSSYQGKLKEITQLGAELMNDASVDADAEMIALIIDCLLKTGLKEFHVEIGHADFFNGLAFDRLVQEADFAIEEIHQLKSLIIQKNIFGVEELLSSKNISEDLKEIFLKLPELFGNIENLTYAKSMAKSPRAISSIERLEKLYHILEAYGFKDYISFDLSMVSQYDYYTGIIFKAYTYGTGEAIVTGGRYDNLVKQFGKDAPAIGFAIVIDQLMNALSRQKIEVKLQENKTMILYSSADRIIAISLANQFRSDGMEISLLRKSLEQSKEEYIEYASRNHFGGILFIQDEEYIELIDIRQQTSKLVKLSDLAN